jgi:hypothetical protein
MRVLTASGGDLTKTDDSMQIAKRQITGDLLSSKRPVCSAKVKADREHMKARTGNAESASPMPKPGLRSSR